MTSEWREIYTGGSEEAEQQQIREWARTIVEVQEANRRRSKSELSHRTFHAKLVVGVTGAELAFDPPAELQAGAFVPGARLATTVRLSNANGAVRPDTEADLRGAALKIALPDGTEHDLLMTSYPVSHARNAAQFVKIAAIGAGSRAVAIPRMLAAFGPRETLRIVGNLRKATRVSESLALESYWSRGAILWGDAGPVRFRLSPLDPAPARPVPEGPQRLTEEFAARLAHGPVRFALSVQRFADERTTPIEDGAVEWTGEWIQVATLTIPRQEPLGAVRDHVDTLAFNPWQAPDEFRPLGGLNRARRTVYTASASNWQKD